jgi:Tol biopolymer transport system component
MLALALATVTVTAAHATPDSKPRNGDWIAYAWASAADQICCTRMFGSDIFIVQPGGTPKLVAGRANGSIWNVCPAFSPNGKLLAFGQKALRSLPSIRVARVSRDGTISKRRIVRSTSKVHGAWATCPKWSADGKRIAYPDKQRRMVVMTIDGARGCGGPAIRPTRTSPDATTLVSTAL